VPNRDIIVIGASMGGIEAIRRLLSRLPANLPATIFCVVHTGTSDAKFLARAIGGRSALPVTVAQEGERYVRGRAYVAPGDHHLLVGEDHIHVRRGPSENGSRPAIDPLFRSAAATCTTRVLGIVLTGLLNDGTAGLRAIKKCGGITVVQDPADAEFDPMPKSAIRHVEVDYVCPLEEIPVLMAELTAEARPPPVEVSENIRMEALIAAQEVPRMEEEWSASATISPITCPECHGTMQEMMASCSATAAIPVTPSRWRCSARLRPRRGSERSTAPMVCSRNGPSCCAAWRTRHGGEVRVRAPISRSARAAIRRAPNCCAA
jgi:two-component system, chemotaxis family, protein-glutamate methylesterase/glutaminase